MEGTTAAVDFQGNTVRAEAGLVRVKPGDQVLVHAVSYTHLFFWGGDILLVFFALTLAGIFFIMSACSANAPYSSMGAQRELMQMMPSYVPDSMMQVSPAVILRAAF